jgi:putative flavoprotein involved in K+ transport
VDQAIEYCLRAGRVALSRSANVEATAQLQKGLQLLDGLTDPSRRDREEIDYALKRYLVGRSPFDIKHTVGVMYHDWAGRRVVCAVLRDLPVRTGVRVDRVWRDGARYIVEAGDRRLEADHVVVAMASFQAARLPEFAPALDPSIVQLHSSEYKNPAQLRPGDVLVVGAGNSGADIALEVARSRRVWLSGRHPGHVPFRIESRIARAVLPFLFRVVFHRILTVDTPMGRKARPAIISKGGPLIRVKPADLVAAGVERTPRVTDVRDGKPLLADGRVLDVTNVIWCTGFHPGLNWIDLPKPVCGADGEPVHDRGIVPDEPGLYFVGLHFLYSFSSTMIHGVARDAERITATIQTRVRGGSTARSTAAVVATA